MYVLDFTKKNVTLGSSQMIELYIPSLTKQRKKVFGREGKLRRSE